MSTQKDLARQAESVRRQVLAGQPAHGRACTLARSCVRHLRRTSVRMSLVGLSMVLAVTVTFLTTSAVIHLLPAVTSFPTFMAEVLDRVVFHAE